MSSLYIPGFEKTLKPSIISSCGPDPQEVRPERGRSSLPGVRLFLSLAVKGGEFILLRHFAQCEEPLSSQKCSKKCELKTTA